MIEKGKISQEPFIEILKTLEEAESANLIDWNAMNIASVDQMSQPSSRIIEKASEEDSDDYFYSRPLKSRVSAIISNQSSKISSYEDLTNQIDNYLEQNDESSIKRPDHCGLYIVIPNAVEFWEERDNRTHERLKYILSDDQKWSSYLLSP